MSEYSKTCKFCKAEIKMSDESGKWKAINKDGNVHDCRKRQEITLEAVQQKLESLGIIVNMERLMKA
jgi:hypothetical protein